MVIREVVAPSNFIQYLRENLPRFYRAKTYTYGPRMSRDHRVKSLRLQIRFFETEIAKAESAEDRSEERIDLHLPAYDLL